MTRSGMIRLGSALLALASAGAPTQGALIRYEFSAPRLEAAAGPPSPTSPFSGRLSYDDPPDIRKDATGHPRPEFDLGPAGPNLPDWMLGEYADVRCHLARPARSTPAGRPWGPTHAEALPAATDEPSDSPEDGPPLTLAAFLGVAAWAVLQRFAPARAAGPARRRREPSARSRGTAMVLACDPAPMGRRSAARPRALEAHAAARPLVLAASFVEVSVTVMTPALPAPRRLAGASAVSVRRRASVRRIPA